MLEEILDIRNVQRAFKQVTANKGAGGIDGIQADELRDYLNTSWQRLRANILKGDYRSNAVRKVEITKSIGDIRMLGTPVAGGKFEEIPIEVSPSGRKTNLIGYMNSAHAILFMYNKNRECVELQSVICFYSS